MPWQSEKILIVDDEESVRSIVQRNIERIGATSFIACDGQAGLEAAAEVDPAVIVLDLRMPKMDGHTFMRRFQRLDLDSAIIVTSADGEMDDVIEAMRNGAIDFLRKPFSNGDIQAALVKALEIHDRRRTAAVSHVAEPASISPPRSADAPNVSRPSLSAALPEILKKLQGGEIVLPSVPVLISELRDTIANQTATMESVARLVSSDQALATRVLQVGKSVFYAGGTPSLDIAAVISRVGFQKVQSLAETVWLNGCFQIADPAYAATALQQARFGLARAIAMRAIALALKLDPSTAYFAGLFADVGASFLLYVIAEKSSAAPDVESCRRFVREHHEQIGAQLLAKWGYREDLVRHARLHHSAPRDAYSRLFVLGNAAARMLTGAEDPTGEQTPATLLERCSSELKLEARTRERVFEIAGSELSSLEESLA